jgi:DNA-binding ferritin-like protein
MKRRDRVRVTIDLTPAQYDQLCLLEDNTGAGTKAEVMRQALKSYEYIVNRYKNGDEIIARSKDGKEEKLIFVEAILIQA